MRCHPTNELTMWQAIDKMKEVSCSAKQVVFEQGAPGDGVYVVETGVYTGMCGLPSSH